MLRLLLSLSAIATIRHTVAHLQVEKYRLLDAHKPQLTYIQLQLTTRGPEQLQVVLWRR